MLPCPGKTKCHPDGSPVCAWKANNPHACDNLNGDGKPCPRPEMSSQDSFDFRPYDEASFLMLLAEQIEVVGRAPAGLIAKDIIGLVINQRVKDMVRAEIIIQERAQRSLTGSARR